MYNINIFTKIIVNIVKIFKLCEFEVIILVETILTEMNRGRNTHDERFCDF